MATIYKRNCDHCGKYYEGTGEKFCSRKCVSMAKGVEIICKTCTKKFKASLSENRKYCSYKCFNQDVRENKILIRAGREIRKCHYCNKEFEVKGHKLNDETRGKFCSVKCHDNYRKTLVGDKNPKYESDKHVKRKCKWCGKEFKIHKCRIDRERKAEEGQFCSRACTGAYVARYRQDRVSKAEIEFYQTLKENNIDVKHQVQVGSFVADFLVKDTNWLIEFDGEYWHSLERIKNKDKRKEKCYKEKGYRLIRVNERDYINNKENIINKIKEKTGA